MDNTIQYANPEGLIEQAANLFMTVQVSIGTYKGTILNRSAAKVAADNAGVDWQAREAGRLYIDILGSHHSHLKAVIAKFTLIRTFVYESTQPMDDTPGQKRGPLLIQTSKVPEFLSRLNTLKRNAMQALDEFLVKYDDWAEDAKRQLSDWAEGREYPSASDIRQKFYVEVLPPLPLQVVRVKDINLPVHLAEQLASQSVHRATKQLNVAKAATVEAAEQHFQRLVNQLTNGQRFHESLISAAKQHGGFLRDLSAALGEPNLKSIADDIDHKVLNVSSVEHWKTSPHFKAEAAKAATKVLGDIKQVRKDVATQQVMPAPAQPAQQAGEDGILADLW